MGLLLNMIHLSVVVLNNMDGQLGQLIIIHFCIQESMGFIIMMMIHNMLLITKFLRICWPRLTSKAIDR